MSNQEQPRRNKKAYVDYVVIETKRSIHNFRMHKLAQKKV